MANIAEATAAGHEFRGWHLTHSLPIPDCHERVTELGLATGAEALWFVEEDTVVPDGALMASIRLRKPIVAVDYPVGENPTWSAIPHFGATILWCGLGCTLISRRVFERMARPWFSTQSGYEIRRNGSAVPDLIERADSRPDGDKYGQQDIYFFRHVIEAGFVITQIPGMRASQAKVREYGKPQTNIGAHRIELVTQIEREQVSW